MANTRITPTDHRPPSIADLLKPVPGQPAFTDDFRLTDTDRDECQRYETAAMGHLQSVLSGLSAMGAAMAYAQDELSKDAQQNLAWLLHELAEQAYQLLNLRDDASHRLYMDAKNRTSKGGEA